VNGGEVVSQEPKSPPVQPCRFCNTDMLEEPFEDAALSMISRTKPEDNPHVTAMPGSSMREAPEDTSHFGPRCGAHRVNVPWNQAEQLALRPI
jgi:hypothetical protein